MPSRTRGTRGTLGPQEDVQIDPWIAMDSAVPVTLGTFWEQQSAQVHVLPHGEVRVEGLTLDSRRCI